MSKKQLITKKGQQADSLKLPSSYKNVSKQEAQNIDGSGGGGLRLTIKMTPVY